MEQGTRNQEQGQNGYSLYAEQVNAAEIVPKVFGELTTMRACEFKQKTMRCFPEVSCDTAYRILLSQAYQLELITKRKMNDTETYYDLSSPTKKQDTSQEIPSLFWVGAAPP